MTKLYIQATTITRCGLSNPMGTGVSHIVTRHLDMRKILIQILQNLHSTIFSYIFRFIFLIDAIKPNVEKLYLCDRLG